MEPAAGGRADVFGDVRGESDDVVIERFLEFFAALDVEGGFGAWRQSYGAGLGTGRFSAGFGGSVFV